MEIVYRPGVNYYLVFAQTLFAPLREVQIPMRQRGFAPASKLTQILLSILAGCETLSVLPIIIVFIFAQRSLIEGMTAGSLKG